MTEEKLNQLVTLSNHLGDPTLDYAILGEGSPVGVEPGWALCDLRGSVLHWSMA